MRKKGTALLLAGVLAVSLLGGCSSKTTTVTDAAVTEAATQVSTAETEKGKFTPGTYEGEGTGRNGLIKVAVTLSSDKIEKIEVLEQTETEGIGNLAFDAIIPSIVENQSIMIDAVAGATITSDGLLQAVEAALVSAGADVDILKVAVSSNKKAEDQIIDTEIAIIGAGGAGLAAAASAAEQGAKVVVLEKMVFTGGNTLVGEGTYNSPDEKRQSAQNVEDSVEKFAEDTFVGGDSLGDKELIQVFASEAYPTLEWLESTIGVPFKAEVFTAIGGKWCRGHAVDLKKAGEASSDGGGRVYITKLQAYAEGKGAAVMTDANVKEIIMKDGRAVGVIAERSDGSVITVNAAKGVIIATGGFSANAEMVHQYDPSITTTLTSNAASCTGDGILLAQSVKAALRDMGEIQVHPLGDPETGGVAAFVGNWLGVEEYAFVNKEGKRFVKEDGTRAELSAAELLQTDGQMWLLVDSSAINYDERGTQIDELVASKKSYKADTLEDLAKQIGVDPAALTETIKIYNDGLKAGEDEYGKELGGPENMFDTPPYYASIRQPTVHHTMGGIVINTDTQVIGEDGNAIPGLYAAGEVTGGIHGGNRLGGNAFTDIMTFGKIAGIKAAAVIE